MQIYYTELTIDEGFSILNMQKNDRLVKGRQVSACSGWNLFKTLQQDKIKCWSCGCVADRWIADRGKNNLQGHPVLNLYALRDNTIVLMNRDHIIPKSLGGTDDNENLRPACEICNTARKNSLTKEELEFRNNNPHLVSALRLEQGKANARKAIKRHNNDLEKIKIEEPFKLIGEEL